MAICLNECVYIYIFSQIYRFWRHMTLKWRLVALETYCQMVLFALPLQPNMAERVTNGQSTHLA